MAARAIVRLPLRDRFGNDACPFFILSRYVRPDGAASRKVPGQFSKERNFASQDALFLILATLLGKGLSIKCASLKGKGDSVVRKPKQFGVDTSGSHNR